MPHQMEGTEPGRRVIEVAADIFAAEGYAGARVDEIATRAGVNKAMVYYHVGDKDHLYATVLNEKVDMVLAALEAAVTSERGPENKLRAAIGAIARTATENPHFAPLMLREFAAGGAGLGDEVLRKIAGVFQIVGRILEEGRELGVFRDVDPVVTHMTIAGSLLVLVSATPIRARLREMQGVPSRPFAKRNPEDLADSVYRLVSEGLRVPQRRRKSSKITSVTPQGSRRS